MLAELDMDLVGPWERAGRWSVKKPPPFTVPPGPACSAASSPPCCHHHPLSCLLPPARWAMPESCWEQEWDGAVLGRFSLLSSGIVP